MTVPAYTASATPRATALGAMALLALAVHGAVLFGIQWEIAPTAVAAAYDQGVAIDLSPAPQPPEPEQKPEQPAAAQSPAPPPPPREVTEPDPPPLADDAPKTVPKKAAPPVQRTRNRITAMAGTDAKPAATETQQTQPTAPPSPHVSPDLTRTAASDPEPLPQTVNRKPKYPYLARTRGQEGTALLSVRVDATGEVLDLAVAQSSGFPLLDEAALRAVRRWRFTPARRAGLPVVGTVNIPVEFLLTK